MDKFFSSSPLQLISLEIFKNDKKCLAWAKHKVKNRKQTSVNQSNKEAKSNKQKGCTKKKKMSQKQSFKIRFFEFTFGISDI